MEREDITKLAIVSGLGGFMLIWYLFFFILFLKNLNIQFIKSKSPRLTVLSFAGNFLAYFVILLTLMAGIRKKDKIVGFDISFVFNAGFTISECILAPLMLATYLFRIIQLIKIFTISNTMSEQVHTKSKWFRQNVYIILALIIFVIALAFGVALILIYNTTSIEPAFSTKIILIAMTINFATILPVVVFGIILVSKLNYFTEMRVEIIALALTWTVLSAAFHFLAASFADRLNGLYNRNMRFFLVGVLFVILLLRNMIVFIIQVVIPVSTHQEEKLIPFGETRKCASNVEMALSSELPFTYFFFFIVSVDATNGENIMNLFIQMKLFDDDKKSNFESDKEMAEDIVRNYLTEESRMYIQFIPKEIKADIIDNINNGRIDKKLFRVLYRMMLPKLQKYFESFKQSELYKTLCIELKRNEIIYERLVNANLI